MKQFGFPKREHLCLKRDIDALFTSRDHSTTIWPLRCLWRIVDVDADMPPIQMLVSVSKRHFKHAVDRNRCKRQVREAYRLNKAKVTAAVPEGKSVHIAFIWLADTQQPSALVHSKTQRLLGDIAKSL